MRAWGVCLRHYSTSLGSSPSLKILTTGAIYLSDIFSLSHGIASSMPEQSWYSLVVR
jgi:hypothetical protein